MNESCCVEYLNGDVLLSPCKLLNEIGPNGIKLTTVKLSRGGVTFLWFINFLEGKEEIPNENPAEGRTYKTTRDSAGNVFLEDIREDKIVSVVGFSADEIPAVLKKLSE